MPAEYAHHRFGGTCIDTMPEMMKGICKRHREIFDFGVHGPDILFYHQPLKKNPVNQLGAAMHHCSGREFFLRCREIYLSNERKPEMLAYMLGFLSHFTLDSTCHGYIDERTESLEISHNYIESQYEAFLLREDGRDPLKENRASHLRPSKKTAEVIALFFDVKEDQVLTALKGQKSVMKLLYSPRERKKKILRKVIRLGKLGGHFDDLFLDGPEDPRCAETNAEIRRLQTEAEQLYPVLMKNLMEYLLDGTELSERFEYNFEGNIHSF